MEPQHYIRLLMRQWVWLVLCLSTGAVLGYGSSLLQDDDPGPIVEHWVGAEILRLTPDANFSLEREAVAASGGALVAEVADQLGVSVEDLGPRIRTITDRTEATLTISVVATSEGEARDSAEAVTDAFLAMLESRNGGSYDDQVADLERQLAAARETIDALDPQIADLRARNNSEVALSDTDLDTLSRLENSRTSAFATLDATIAALNGLIADGPAPAPLEKFETATPFRISEREFNRRVASGRQNQRNFDVGQVDLADTSSPTVSERLESPILRAILGAIAGLLLGIMASLIHMRLDPRMRTRDAVERAFDLPVLTEVPNMARKESKRRILHARARPQSAVAEAYRYLRSVLLFARGSASTASTGAHAEPGSEAAEVRVLMVTSCGAGEGKTTSAANLAVLMAESGYRTLLMNCDFRLPTAHQMFDLDYKPGTVQATGVHDLFFLADVPRVDGDTPGVVSERQRRVIRRARDRFDLVVLDTAPVLATNDAVELLHETDVAVIVAREGKTTKEAAAEARELLVDRMGVPVAGVAITAAGSTMAGGYYEKYRYGSYMDKDAPTLWGAFRAKLSRKEQSVAPPLASEDDVAPSAPVDPKPAAGPRPVPSRVTPQGRPARAPRGEHRVNGHTVEGTGAPRNGARHQPADLNQSVFDEIDRATGAGPAAAPERNEFVIDLRDGAATTKDLEDR